MIFHDYEKKQLFICHQSLKMISFKTVIAALRGSDFPIVKALLVNKGINKYHLIIRVS
jgi:hypothetical protein